MTTLALPHPPRLVVFDLDGTLVDSIGDIARSANDALAERYGPEAALPVDTVRSFVGGGARLLVLRCLDALGQPPGHVDEVFDRFLHIYRSRLVETTRLYEGMREALDVIGRHATLAVLTNKPGVMSRVIVRELGLEGRFLGVVGGDDLATRKPDPEGLRHLAARANVRIEDTALVGDSAVDIQTSRNAGALAIGVLWGYDRGGVERENHGVRVETPKALARLFEPARAL